jgi:hypothetical protein
VRSRLLAQSCPAWQALGESLFLRLCRSCGCQLTARLPGRCCTVWAVLHFVRLERRTAASCVAQALADHGDSGRSALQALLARLAGDQEAQHSVPDGAALVDAVMRSMAPGLPSVADAELSTSATMVLAEARDAQRDLCLMTPAEAAELPSPQDHSCHRSTRRAAAEGVSAQPAGAPGEEQPPVLLYVRHVARAVATWAAQSGHGVVQVTEHGSMIQMGETRARLVPMGPAAQRVGAGGPAGTGGPAAGVHVGQSVDAWAWEVLWGGSHEHVADAAVLSEALMATAGGDAVQQGSAAKP